jgi:hypothetical protein
MGDKTELTSEFAKKIYHRAQLNDQFPGQEPEMSGTSVIAALRELKKLGKISEFRWAFGLHEALLGLSWFGPAVIGVPWYEGMEPDKFGYLHPTGRIVGGHCCLVNSTNIHRKTIRIHNSWGIGWGTDGGAWMTWEDFEILLSNGGECAFLTK